MEKENTEGIVLSTVRRGNYEYTQVKFGFTKAEGEKLNKTIEHDAGKISAIAVAENDKECIITFKKKVKHLKKGLR